MPAKDKAGGPPKKAPEYATRDEQVAAFRALLREANVGAETSWAVAMRNIINDERWGALKTLGEKKQVFTEYQAARAKEDRELTRARKKQAADTFLSLLLDVPDITARSRWKEVREGLVSDERFKVVAEEREREELFEEYLRDLADKDRQARSARRGAQVEAFRAWLAEAGDITETTRWTDVKDRVVEDARFDALDKGDFLREFQEYVLGLEKAVAQARREAREARRAQEDAARAAFAAWLGTDPRFNAKCRWKTFAAHVEAEPTFLALKEFNEGYPREVFEKALDAREAALHDTEKALKRILKHVGVAVQPGLTFASFCTLVAAKSAAAGPAPVSSSSSHRSHSRKRSSRSRSRSRRPDPAPAPPAAAAGAAGAEDGGATGNEFEALLGARGKEVAEVFEGLMEEAASRATDDHRKRERAAARFHELLADYYTRREDLDTAWKDAERRLARHSAFADVEAPDRQPLFDLYMDGLREKLDRKASGGGGDEEKDKKAKKEKKEKKEKKSHKHKKDKKEKRSRSRSHSRSGSRRPSKRARSSSVRD